MQSSPGIIADWRIDPKRMTPVLDEDAMVESRLADNS
jgi:hypothetical protein